MKKFLPCLAIAWLLLAGATAGAQTTPPVLGGPPATPPPAPPAAAPVPPAAAPDPVVPPDNYLLGRVYRVETNQGTSFTGTLVSLSLTSLEFDAQELGHIRLERTQVRHADLQGPLRVGKSAGYYDIGNGNRLFFAPTGRGLRKGEGALQDVDVYLLGLNYGITDNISLGGYVSVFPGFSPDQQFLAFTPKISYPVGDNLHAGFGLLYVRVPKFDSNGSGTGVGIAYGALTYGGADNNFTVGLGYGFVQGDIGKTPIIQVGGQRRVSRRVSLVSENYIIADAKAGMGGLYGIKLNWRRTSLGMGALYFYTFPYTENNGYNYPDKQGGYFISSYVIPLYFDFTFRFGKGAQPTN